MELWSPVQAALWILNQRLMRSTCHVSHNTGLSAIFSMTSYFGYIYLLEIFRGSFFNCIGFKLIFRPANSQGDSCNYFPDRSRGERSAVYIPEVKSIDENGLTHSHNLSPEVNQNTLSLSRTLLFCYPSESAHPLFQSLSESLSTVSPWSRALSPSCPLPSAPAAKSNQLLS